MLTSEDLVMRLLDTRRLILDVVVLGVFHLFTLLLLPILYMGVGRGYLNWQDAF